LRGRFPLCSLPARPRKRRRAWSAAFPRHRLCRWRNQQLDFSITTEDARLSRTCIEETAAHLIAWTAAYPGGPKLRVVPSLWNDLPSAPSPSRAFGGIVIGRLRTR
jgi:hypothetical protein